MVVLQARGGSGVIRSGEEESVDVVMVCSIDEAERE